MWTNIGKVPIFATFALKAFSEDFAFEKFCAHGVIRSITYMNR
jgi:hypothetical protein